jgi:hypothetical protein
MCCKDSSKERLMEKVVIELKVKTLEEAIKKLGKQLKSPVHYSSIRLKTKNFKFNREKAESRQG